MIRSTFLMLFISVFIFEISAQTCTGNLGANIFEDGEFGNGRPNISLNFQNIAPGYIFTTDVPPRDGQYTITNNTTFWGSFAVDNWINIMDNSPDSEGYMMVVNASFEPGLFYDQRIDGLCENTLYEFSADLINLIVPGLPDHIAPNVTFQIDGVDRFNTGDIPQDAVWHTESFTFTTLPGQTTVQLSLRNNAPGGIGNDVALDNIFFRACGPEALILPREIEQICENGNPITLFATINGDQYPDPAVQWQIFDPNSETWNDILGETNLTTLHTDLSAGTYFYRYLLANGTFNLANTKCRVISNVKEIFVQPKFWFIQDSLCAGTFVEFGGQQITQSGVFVDSLISSIGCDSVLTYDLTFVPNNGINVDFTIENPSCDAASDGRFIINEIENANAPLSYILNGDTITDLQILEQLPIGNFTLEIVDRFQCDWSTTFDLQVIEPLLVDIGSDIVIELGDSVNLQVVTNQDLINCNWMPEEARVLAMGCEELTIRPFQNTTIEFSTTTLSGCSTSDQVNITVLDVRKVFIPSAFSPNNDGINDVFMIFGDIPNVQSIQSFSVFDRWGNMLFRNQDFQPNEISEGWDGTFRGKPIDLGVYIFVAEVVFIDGLVEVYSGDILLNN